MATKTKDKPTAPETDEVRLTAPPPLPPVMPPKVYGEVALESIRPCPFNIRKSFPDDDIAGLAESIRTVGVLTQLIVRPVGVPGCAPTFKPGRGWSDVSHYELADGERRYRALLLLNETHSNDGDGPIRVPVDIRPLTDDEVRALMLVTREQSRDISLSALVAAYTELRVGKTVEAVAQLVGKEPRYVRSVLSLAGLQSWALPLLDSGTLNRTTAELIAKIPGEESQKRCLACVLMGIRHPADLDTFGHADLDDITSYVGLTPLSSQDTKDLIRIHFQVELKGAPFDRKSLELLPAAGSCEECPNRAGNNSEAIADGVRADMCLNPDCYRLKVSAYREQEVAAAWAKGIGEAPIDDGFTQVPRGWCDLSEVIWKTDLHADFPASHNQNPKREEKLGKVLGTECPMKYIAFDRKGAPVTLVKTSEARAALVKLGVIKKADRPKSKPAAAARKGGISPAKPAGPSSWEITEKATAIAAKVLGEYTAEQCEALADLPDAQKDGPILEALKLATRCLAYDALTCGGERLPVVRQLFPQLDQHGSASAAERKKIDGALSNFPAPLLVSALVQLAAASELHADGPQMDAGHDLLAFAELDWPALEQQARRELTGGETAEQKVAKAEADIVEPAIPQTKADVAKPKSKGAKSK